MYARFYTRLVVGCVGFSVIIFSLTACLSPVIRKLTPGQPFVIDSSNNETAVRNTVSFTLPPGTAQYSFSIPTNRSGASIQVTGPNTAVYTAGTVAYVSDIVSVTDSSGYSETTSISVAPGTPDHLMKISGDSQSGQIESSLTNPLKVRLVDRWGNFISGQPLAIMQLLSFDSQLIGSPIQTTDENGYAQFQVKLGSSPKDLWQVASATTALPNLAGISGGSSPIFAETATSLGNGTFVSHYYTVGNQPVVIKSADLRGIGKIDLVVLNGNDQSVSVLLGNGDGTFQPQTSYSVGAFAGSMAMGDFNGDGRPDIVTTSYSGNSISILLNNGDGTFGTPSIIGAFISGSGVAVGDFNKDGKLDLAVGGCSGGLAIFLGNGDGTFQSPAIYPETNDQTTDVQVTDLNGDGNLDVAMVDQNNDFEVFLGNGDGTFQAGVTTAISAGELGSIAWVDLNGDGKVDAVVADYLGGKINVLIGNGDGTFNAAVPYSSSLFPTGLAVGDFNGDGKVDVAVSSRTGNPALFLGNGDGTLQSQATLSGSTVAQSILAGDFNGDGKQDLAVPSTGNSVEIFLGKGDGSFNGGPVTIASIAGTYAVTRVGDINGDGTLDVVALDTTNSEIAVFLGNGDGTFRAEVNYPASGFSDFVLGDFNGDGKMDIAASDFSDSSIQVLVGNGDGTFQPQVTTSIGVIGATHLAEGDLNRDGKLDLLLTNGSTEIETLLSNGDGTFRFGALQTLSHAVISDLALGDFNHDGQLDVAVLGVSSSFSSIVGIITGNGDGTFNAEVTQNVGSSPGKIAIFDFNGDGNPDIAALSSSDDEFSVLLGNGDGTFQSPVVYSTGAGSGPQYFAIGDFNGDGVADMIVANNSLPAIGLFFGNSNGTFQSQVLYPTAFAASSLAVGDLTGNGKLNVLMGTSGLSYLVPH